MRFYDRQEELRILSENEEASKSHASFMVMMGRRRVGKTSLLTKAFAGTDYAYLFVSRDSEAMLCGKFQRALEEQLGIHVYGTTTHLRELFEVMMKESTLRHFTLIIDEFQDLYKVNSASFSDLQDVWDRYHTQSKINLIACGSIHTLMKRIFEDKSEPLYGRPTSKMTIRPFTTAVLKSILADANPHYGPEDLLCLYMLTGGVAKYIELLIDRGATNKEKMLDTVCSQDSYFLSEGHDLLVNEFQGDYGTYYSILQLIASGLTRRSEIDGALQKDAGTFLKKLDEDYGMISKLQPIMAKPGSKTSMYEIHDNFLRFWFRFIYPYQSIVERGQLGILRKYVGEQYTQFSGRSLERYFQDKLMENGQYTNIGNWWDRKGKNEIDIVAMNEFDHTATVGEVKRNPDRISMKTLKDKAAFLPANPFGHYKIDFKGFSLQDM